MIELIAALFPRRSYRSALSLAIAATIALFVGGSLANPRPQYVIQVFNVLDYGAKCDGSTNDLAAIKATIADACNQPGSIVYTPPSAGCMVGQDGGNPWSVNLPCGDVTLLGARGSSFWIQTAGLPASPVALLRIETQDLVTVDSMGFSGNWGNAATTISDSSNNVALSGTYTVNVASTAGFPAAPLTINVQSATGTATGATQNNVVACTGKTATSFTGCTGGSGVMMRDYTVGFVDANTGINQGTQANPQNHLILSLGSTNLTIQNSIFRQAYGDAVNLTNDTVDNTKWTTNAKVLNSTVTMTARNGVMLAGGVNAAQVEGNVITYTFGVDVDLDPGNFPTRSALIESNVVTPWWDPTLAAVNFVGLQVKQGAGGYGLWGGASTACRVEHNTVNGPVMLTGVWNLGFTDNSIYVDAAGNTGTGIQAAPLTVQTGGGDVTVIGNYFYTRAPQSGSDGAPDTGAISVFNTGSGSDGSGNALYFNPVRVRISNNSIDAQNGHHGIVLTSPGGNIQNFTSTTSAITLTTLTDTSGTGTFTTNQFVGQTVQVGSGAQAVITSNTSCAAGVGGCTLTLTLLNGSTSTAWQSPIGEYAPTPAAGSYTVSRAVGTIDVFDNQVTLKNTSGFGQGKDGVHLTNGAQALPGGRVRIHNNNIRDANSNGVSVVFPTGGTYPVVDIFRNYGVDDQVTPTFTNLTSFTNAPAAGSFVLSDNVAGENVTNEVSGLTSGTWLLHDGVIADWAGFGSPNSVVTAPLGSTYRQLDGTSPSINWTKQTGTGNTGWVADALQSTSPTFTGATIGTQTISTATSGLSPNHGALGTGSTNWWGNVTGIGANNSVVLTLGGGGFLARGWCQAAANTSTTTEVIVVTNSATTPTFSCFSSTTGLGSNCVDFTYSCVGQ